MVNNSHRLFFFFGLDLLDSILVLELMQEISECFDVDERGKLTSSSQSELASPHNNCWGASLWDFVIRREKRANRA